MKGKFPDYFNNFKLPEGAREETLTVYRACKSGKCDKASFQPTFEEQGCSLGPLDDPCDPSMYSLSTYLKPKDIKRFAAMDSDMHVPYKIAIGKTEPKCGLIQPTKERKKKSKSSHVDWWLYEDAKPYREFSLIDDFDQHLIEYKKEKERNG